MLWRKLQQPGGEPIERIFNCVLACAVHDGAHEIRIEKRTGAPLSESPDFAEGFEVVVSFLFGEESKEQMALPPYIQPALLTYIRRRAAMEEMQNSGEIRIDLRDESNDLHLALCVSIEITRDETAVLRPRFLHSNLDFPQ